MMTTMSTDGPPWPSIQINTIEIASPSLTTPLPICTRRPLFVLGRNGTGKSALVQSLVTQLRPSVVYLPGSRPAFFADESLGMTMATRRDYELNSRIWDDQPDVRWRQHAGPVRNEKAIHDLQSAETQYKVDAANEIRVDGASSAAILRLQSGTSPLDRVNHLLAKGNIPVELLLHANEVKATRGGGAPYSIARMSDGERSALVLIADIIASQPGSVFLIDEPDLHLHRAIVVPLVSALIAERPDCAFIISTHELSLPGAVAGAQALLVRDCTWDGDHVHQWTIDVLPTVEDIPEDLRVDVLGSRRTILFVEGTDTSLDQPLYALLFPLASIRCRASCGEVRKAVAGLRAVTSLHDVAAFGLVDQDSQPTEQVAALEEEGIFALPAYSVESLYYALDLVQAVAQRQAETLSLEANALVDDAVAAGLAALASPALVEHLASRVSEQHMRQAILAHLPDRRALIAQRDRDVQFTVPSPFPAERQRLQYLVAGRDLAGIIARYPVRESGVLDAIARALHFASRADYERAALQQVASNAAVADAIAARLGAVATHLRG